MYIGRNECLYVFYYTLAMLGAVSVAFHRGHEASRGMLVASASLETSQGIVVKEVICRANLETKTQL